MLIGIVNQRRKINLTLRYAQVYAIRIWMFAFRTEEALIVCSNKVITYSNSIIFDRAYNACQSHLRQFSRANSGLLQNGVGDWEVRYRRDLFDIFLNYQQCLGVKGVWK